MFDTKSRKISTIKDDLVSLSALTGNGLGFRGVTFQGCHDRRKRAAFLRCQVAAAILDCFFKGGKLTPEQKPIK